METSDKYPFEFVLEIGYKLSGSEIKVTWRVTNPAKKDLLFSIGGHPAFMCPSIMSASLSNICSSI